MSNWFRFLFLFSSFGPLYLIFFVKLELNAGVGRMAPIIAGLACLLSGVAFYFLRRRLHSDNGTIFEVTDVKSKDSEIFSYITTYIPPLISRDMSDPAVYIPLAILYMIIFMAYMRLDSPYLNPYFILLGYRIYEARLPNSRTLAGQSHFGDQNSASSVLR
jgi:hypothetical protein